MRDRRVRLVAAVAVLSGLLIGAGPGRVADLLVDLLPE
jgi:hypothetical protein